jgi:hypothetical protein
MESSRLVHAQNGSLTHGIAVVVVVVVQTGPLVLYFLLVRPYVALVANANANGSRTPSE